MTVDVSMIRKARKQAKLTQQQLSDRYQIPRRTLVDWELGKHEPPIYVVNMLIRCMTIDYGIKLERPKETDYKLTYLDGTPLSFHDEMYAHTENKAKRVVLISNVENIRTYECANGLKFKIAYK